VAVANAYYYQVAKTTWKGAGQAHMENIIKATEYRLQTD
jgi:hypothetical protein